MGNTPHFSAWSGEENSMNMSSIYCLYNTGHESLEQSRKHLFSKLHGKMFAKNRPNRDPLTKPFTCLQYLLLRVTKSFLVAMLNKV